MQMGLPSPALKELSKWDLLRHKAETLVQAVDLDHSGSIQDRKLTWAYLPMPTTGTEYATRQYVMIKAAAHKAPARPFIVIHQVLDGCVSWTKDTTQHLKTTLAICIGCVMWTIWYQYTQHTQLNHTVLEYITPTGMAQLEYMLALAAKHAMVVGKTTF